MEEGWDGERERSRRPLMPHLTSTELTFVNPKTYRQARRSNNRGLRALAGENTIVKNMVFYAAGIKLLKIW
jgi:hypothetical protein